jgi:hypothetical protein
MEQPTFWGRQAQYEAFVWRSAAAPPALARLAHARHGALPVPDLAYRLMAVSAVRRVRVSGTLAGALSVDEGVAFLAAAPINVGALFIGKLTAAEMRRVTDALAAHPCHALMTSLAVEDGVKAFDDKDAARLVEATGGFPRLRMLDAPGDVTDYIVEAAAPTLRDLRLSHFSGETMDLSATPLRRLQLRFCPRLATLLLPPTLRALPGDAFRQCGALAALRLPPGLAAIGNSAFASCRALARLDLSATAVRRIGDGFLFDCVSLQELLLPRPLERIGDRALRGCAMLRAFDASTTALTAVGTHFMGLCCDAVASIALPPSLQRLDAFAFAGFGDATLDLSGANVKEVGRSFAANSGRLRRASLPSTLATVGDFAFLGCFSLVAIDLSLTQLRATADDFMHGCAALTTVLLPSCLSEIGRDAFEGCESLRRLDLSRTQVVAVGSGMMAGCEQALEVQFPPTLRSVGAGGHHVVMSAARRVNPAVLRRGR